MLALQPPHLTGPPLVEHNHQQLPTVDVDHTLHREDFDHLAPQLPPTAPTAPAAVPAGRYFEYTSNQPGGLQGGYFEYTSNQPGGLQGGQN